MTMDCHKNRKDNKKKLPRDRRLKRVKNGIIKHSIRAGQVKVDYDKKMVHIESLYVLKRRGAIHRTAVTSPRDWDLAQIIIQYLSLYKDEDGNVKNALLFPITRQQAYRLIKKYTGKWCHFFRHMRATHNVQRDKMNAFLLAKSMGWKKTAMTDQYVHLYTDDLIEHYESLTREDAK